MIFSRKKKLVRDREAGLVFRWRGGLTGNRGGMTLALFLTSGIFALAFVGMNVKVRKTTPPQRRVAKIMMVSEDDERLRLWADQSSPFPARWDPIKDPAHAGRVEGILHTALADASLRDTEWRQLPEQGNQVQIPDIFQEGERIFPALTQVERIAQPEVKVKLEVRLEALGDLAKRFPEPLGQFDRQIPAGEFGKQFRWFVSVNQAGEVVYLAPVEPSDGEFVKLLERWLMSQTFQASEKPMETGELVTRIGRRRNGDD